MVEQHYYLINKPRGMVSQFVSSHEKKLLCDLDFKFETGTHAVGRLDEDSEGLLLLTTDKRVTRLLFLDKKPHERSYLIMVQNIMSDETLERLKNGVKITIKNGESYIAKPLSVKRVIDPMALYPYASDIREAYPHTWLVIILEEGKHRQIRKMVLAIKHRCLRLVRLSISDISLNGLSPGSVIKMPAKEFFSRLHITDNIT